MLKIAVFGFYSPDWDSAGSTRQRSPVSTRDFMCTVWEMEPPQTRVGDAPDILGFVKLTTVGTQPVYVQMLSDEMAQGAGLLNCDGYIAIIDAVKILAPRTIHNALRRLAELHPTADLNIAAARQNEPEALSSDEIRSILGLHPSLPIMPYVPDEPKTVHRLIRRMVRYIENPDRVPPPIFAGAQTVAPLLLAQDEAERPPAAHQATITPAPRIERLDHVAIRVGDLARALAFYRDLLGFRVLGQIDVPGSDPPRTLTHLDTGRASLVLVSEQGGPPPSGERDHAFYLALRVSGLDDIVARLSQAGVTLRSAPVSTPYGVRLAVIADPDGTLVHLIEGDFVYSRR
jgi:catechol 2,3-dioxygenase-like lactoylglutathione lyase family enzyme